MRKNKYIISLFLILTILLVIFLYTLRDDRKLTSIETFIKEPILYLESLLVKPIDYIKEYKDILKSKKKLIDRLNKLNNIEDKYKILLNEVIDKKEDIKELKSLLNIKATSEYEIVNANIITRSISSFYKNLTLDVGFNDKVSDNLAVINKSGLIGKTIKTTSNTTQVKLLTSANENYQIGVLIKSDNDNIFGVLNNYKNGYFLVSGISYNGLIKTNSDIITSGLDSKYPRGIKIGTVYKVVKDKYDLEQIVYVKPSVDFNNIKYVSIMREK